MGLFKGIGKALSGVVKGISTVVKGVVKFAQSPIGKLLIGVGLTALTGGAGALGFLPKVLGALKATKLGTLFTGFASKFLGPVTNLLTKGPLASVANFIKNAGSSGDLLKMAQELIFARQNTAQPPEPSLHNAANYNLGQLMAWRQAQLLSTQG